MKRSLCPKYGQKVMISRDEKTPKGLVEPFSCNKPKCKIIMAEIKNGSK